MGRAHELPEINGVDRFFAVDSASPYFNFATPSDTA